MSETNLYLYITPIALLFILLEIAACFVFKKKLITFNEAVANFGTQLGNQTTNILVMVGVYYVYGYLWENFRIFTIEVNWWSSILLLLAVDARDGQFVVRVAADHAVCAQHFDGLAVGNGADQLAAMRERLRA